ncbi:MAG: hypothetical protein FWG45_00875 [Oscillospiraceae bacterium]|nr:hypothetical protein [Oscillospiraceae bacterium]
MNKQELFKQIGDIDDDIIAESVEYTKPRISFAKWNIIAVSVATLVLTVTMVFMLHAFKREPMPPQNPETAADVTDSDTIDTDETDYTDDTFAIDTESPETLTKMLTLDDLEWLVEPALPSIEYCWDPCDTFFIDNKPIDERTGEIIGEFHGAHCWSFTRWVFDAERDLFGRYHSGGAGHSAIEMFPMDDIAKHFPNYADKILTVELVDSSKREGEEHRATFKPEAFKSDLKALVFNGEFLSDFVYPQVSKGRSIDLLVAVADDSGKYGVVNAIGDTAIDFIFDDLMLIDGCSAFAKVGGLWGIISLGEATVDGRTENYVKMLSDGDRINDEWKVVQDKSTKKYSFVNSKGERYYDLTFDSVTQMPTDRFECVDGSDLYEIVAMTFYDDNGREYNVEIDGWLSTKRTYHGFTSNTRTNLNYHSGYDFWFEYYELAVGFILELCEDYEGATANLEHHNNPEATRELFSQGVTVKSINNISGSSIEPVVGLDVTFSNGEQYTFAVGVYGFHDDEPYIALLELN